MVKLFYIYGQFFFNEVYIFLNEKVAHETTKFALLVLVCNTFKV